MKNCRFQRELIRQQRKIDLQSLHGWVLPAGEIKSIFGYSESTWLPDTRLFSQGLIEPAGVNMSDIWRIK